MGRFFQLVLLVVLFLCCHPYDILITDEPDAFYTGRSLKKGRVQKVTSTIWTTPSFTV